MSISPDLISSSRSSHRLRRRTRVCLAFMDVSNPVGFATAMTVYLSACFYGSGVKGWAGCLHTHRPKEGDEAVFGA